MLAGLLADSVRVRFAQRWFRSGEHSFPRFGQLRVIIRMDGEERIARLDLFSHFVMDDESYRVIDRVRLFSAAGSKRDGRLAHGPGLDLSQVPALRRQHHLDKFRLREL